MIKIYILSCLLLIFSGYTFGRNSSMASQEDSTKILATYTGGRFMYSSITLKLYKDSSYRIAEWVHVGTAYSEIGTFSLTDSLITFYPKKSKMKRKGKVSRLRNSPPKSFEIHGNQILLYDPKEDTSGYGAEYKTLYLNAH